MRWLVCARLASGIADFALPVVLSALVLVRWHGTAVEIGLVLGAHVAGSLIPAPRLRPAWLLAGAAAGQAAVLALAATSLLTAPLLAVFMLWRGFGSASFTRAAPVRSRFGGLVLAVVVVVGPLLGYLLTAGPGIVSALCFDAAMLAIGAACGARVAPAPARWLRTGWREVVHRGWLLRLLVALAAVNLLAAGPLLTLAPVSRGVFGYALMLSAIGAGAVAGSVLSRYPRGGAMVWLTAAAVGPLVLALGAPLPLVVLAFVMVGAVQPVHDVLLCRTLRGGLPREALGPVSAVEEVSSLAALPVGQVLGGLVIDRFGLAPAAWLIVCALPVLSAVPLPRPRRRPGRAGIRSGSPASAGLR
jgi:hypothetical protein